MVAVFPRTTGTFFWEAFHAGVIDEAEGASLYWNGPSDESDAAGQLDLVELYGKKRYRGIILAPIDTMASRSVILEAIQDRVPTVIINDVQGAQPGAYFSYVSNDERMGGLLAAEYVTKILHGRGSIAVVGISGRLASLVLREEAFEEAIARIAPHIEVQVRRYGDLNVSHQQQIAQAILRSSTRVDAVVALSAPATRGVFFAKLATTPKSTVPLVGFDQDLLVPLATGDVAAVVAQNTRMIGRQAMLNLRHEMHGESSPGVTLVPPVLVTAGNLHSTEVRALWGTQPEKADEHAAER